jgi:chemotaxis protein histidine kinase CheA
MHRKGISTGIASDILGLIQDIKEGLLRLKQSLTDPAAAANCIPSIAKAIKNMADVDGYKYVVAFLYVFEDVLGRVRDAELRPKTDLIALLLFCCEHVSGTATQLAHGDEICLGDLKRNHGLNRQLRAYQRNKFEHSVAT